MAAEVFRVLIPEEVSVFVGAKGKDVVSEAAFVADSADDILA